MSVDLDELKRSQGQPLLVPGAPQSPHVSQGYQHFANPPGAFPQLPPRQVGPPQPQLVREHQLYNVVDEGEVKGLQPQPQQPQVQEGRDQTRPLPQYPTVDGQPGQQQHVTQYLLPNGRGETITVPPSVQETTIYISTPGAGTPPKSFVVPPSATETKVLIHDGKAQIAAPPANIVARDTTVTISSNAPQQQLQAQPQPPQAQQQIAHRSPVVEGWTDRLVCSWITCLLTTLMCKIPIVCGMAAIIYSVKARSSAFYGDVEGANVYSRKAKKAIIGAFVGGLVLAMVVAAGFMVYKGFMQHGEWKHDGNKHHHWGWGSEDDSSSSDDSSSNWGNNWGSDRDDSSSNTVEEENQFGDWK